MLAASPEITFWLSIIIFILVLLVAYLSSKNSFLVRQRKEYIDNHKVHIQSYERIIILAAKHEAQIEQMAIRFNEHENKICQDLIALKTRLINCKLEDLMTDLPSLNNLPASTEKKNGPENDQRQLSSTVPVIEERSLSDRQDHQP
jgi:hypothetical protein